MVEPLDLPPTDGLDEAQLLALGVELFNDARYLEAHEVLEILWEKTHDEHSDFFKGILQASIAMHHFREGNLDGARKLYSGHRRYLGAYLPSHLGVDVAAFLESMRSTLSPVLRAQAEERVPFEPEGRPRIVLQSD